MNKNYQNLIYRLEEISRLKGVMSIIQWDQEVTMPTGAAEARANQISALAGVIHERVTDKILGEYLGELSVQKHDFCAAEQCNIEEACREFDLMTKVPKQLVQAIAALSSRGHAIWVQARKENRFTDFAPVIQEFLKLKRVGGMRLS